MARRPIVFAAQEPMYKDADGRWISRGFNLAAAADFGDLVIVWGPDAPIMSPGLIAGQALSAASRYDPAMDYIVALGSPTLIAVLAWAIGRKRKPIRMLEWDKRFGRYYVTMQPSTERQSV